MGIVRWQPLIPCPPPIKNNKREIKAFFGRREMERLGERMASGEAFRDAWRTANDGFDRFLFEAKKTAERIDRRYSLQHRLSSVARSAADRARQIDRDLEITLRFRSFRLHLSTNWPMYRMQLNKFLNTPLGRTFSTILLIWFALSGWLFRLLIFATWVLPFAAPLLIATLSNSLLIKGACPACKMQFAGYKNQVIRCTSCGNIVWQPKADFFSRDGKTKSKSKSDPQIIDVDFEEK
ncbi:hypothetical protein RIF29_32828 [Crotalaria pallida]|uniref:Uncharacterized protein n=1 Tax=Crotalaria pallida TaxID=3830 RepID=A0AAN9I2N0_CROPI